MYSEKMAVTDMSFRSLATKKFLVKEGNSVAVIYERLPGVHGDVYMGASSVRRWVRHLRTETWTLPISRAVVNRELLQLSTTSKKSTSSSDKTEG
jgi:hypothetical protein